MNFIVWILKSLQYSPNPGRIRVVGVIPFSECTFSRISSQAKFRRLPPPTFVVP